jgi:hypothetical protein
MTLLHDQIKEDVMGGTFIKHGGDEQCKILVKKPKGKRPLGRPRHR